MTNPIHKRFDKTRWGRYWAVKRRWLAVCPTCGEEITVRLHVPPSRKTAKDALHQHKLKKHPEPRRDVS